MCIKTEGVLERNRGKPMTVAPQHRAQSARSTRLEALAPPLENLVLAARQLELGVDEVVEALRTKWENRDATALRGRPRPR
jgi:GntR family transcriptional regulator